MIHRTLRSAVLPLALLASACSPSAPPPPAPTAAPPAAPPPAELRFRPAPGTRVRMEMITDQQIGVSSEGAIRTTEQVLGLEFTLEFREAAPGGRVPFRLTFSRTRMRLIGLDSESSYDSERPPLSVDGPFRGVAWLAGKSVDGTFEPDGTAASVSGMDILFDTAAAGTETPAGKEGEALAAQARRQFGDEAMRELATSLNAAFPAGTVAVGDSWKWRRRLRALQPMDIDGTSRFLERKDGRCVLGVEARISPLADGGPTEIGPVTVLSSLSGTMKGGLTVEESTGLVLESALQQELSGYLLVGTSFEDHQETPVLIKSSTSLKRLE